MQVAFKKWGNSAALRVPAVALKSAGIQLDQLLDLQVENGRLVIQPAMEDLDALLARVTPENMHTLAMDDAPNGAEAW